MVLAGSVFIVREARRQGRVDPKSDGGDMGIIPANSNPLVVTRKIAFTMIIMWH
jgi:hypothetical protein